MIIFVVSLKGFESNNEMDLEIK